MTDKEPERELTRGATDGPEPPPRRQILIRGACGGRVEVGYSGDRTTGGNNRTEMANTVVHFLNEVGEQWGIPRVADDLDRSADMIADGPAGKLRLQITRVPWDTAHWASIGRTGHAVTVQSPLGAAGDMISVIRTKARQYSAADRGTLVLVLDGSRSAAYDLPPTLAEFRHLHLDEARSLGFEDVFLVGIMRFINLLNPPEGNEWFSISRHWS